MSSHFFQSQLNIFKQENLQLSIQHLPTVQEAAGVQIINPPPPLDFDLGDKKKKRGRSCVCRTSLARRLMFPS